MKENEILKIFIPLVAVVVIIESVILVQNLNKPSQSLKVKEVTQQNVTETNEAGNSAQTQQSAPAVMDLIFGISSKDMKVGNSYNVEVNMVGKSDFALDAIDLYVKYDSSAFTVSNLTFQNDLKPTFNKVSPQNDLIVSNFLISEPTGIKIANGSSRTVMKFNVVPKKAGNFSFEIASGNSDKESVTMFIENATSKILSFSSNKLNVNVLK
jgi:hypothetical protein